MAAGESVAPLPLGGCSGGPRRQRSIHRFPFLKRWSSMRATGIDLRRVLHLEGCSERPVFACNQDHLDPARRLGAGVNPEGQLRETTFGPTVHRCKGDCDRSPRSRRRAMAEVPPPALNFGVGCIAFALRRPLLLRGRRSLAHLVRINLPSGKSLIIVASWRNGIAATSDVEQQAGDRAKVVRQASTGELRSCVSRLHASSNSGPTCRVSRYRPVTAL